MDCTVAYIAKGELHLKNGDGSVRRIESKFGQTVRQRAMELYKRGAWKREGSSAGFLSGPMLWGRAPGDPETMEIRITGLSRGPAPGELIYALDTGTVSGLFLIRYDTGEELRLMHTADYHFEHLAVGRDTLAQNGLRDGGMPEQSEIACAIKHRLGTASLAVVSCDTYALTEVTEGDSIDVAPSWVPSKRQIVFQSAGIARDAKGQFHGRGAFLIQKVDLDTGELTPLAESQEHDYLGPRVASDGTLYYIRKPYRKPGTVEFKWWRGIVDIVILPFKLLNALFHYFEWFSIKYTGRTLTTASGEKQKEIDLKRRKLMENIYAAQDAIRDEMLSEGENSGLVPGSWQLICESPGESAKTLAKGVVSFDLSGDGSIVYSNGSAVYRLSAGGEAEQLAVGDFIEKVVSLN
jgi:hypothetical protein